jgi:hypothetical protein
MFSVSGLSSNSLSAVAISLSIDSITGRHCVELNLAVSLQYGVCGFRKDFVSLLMFASFTVKYHSKHYSFCLPFCRPLDCAARGGRTTRPTLAAPLHLISFVEFEIVVRISILPATHRIMAQNS